MNFTVDFNKRLNWDSYFMMQAHVVATRSSCIKRHVGCVVVNDMNRIVSCGYNGQVTGFEHCDENLCTRKNAKPGENLGICRAVHAEQNAITYAAGTSTNLSGCKWYCTTMPCIHCFKLILSLNPSLIMFKEGYDRATFDAILNDLKSSTKHNVNICKVDCASDFEIIAVEKVKLI